MRTASLFVLVATLAACADAPAPAPPSDAPAADGAPAPADPAADSTRGPSGETSAYTEIAGCETLRVYEESGGVEQRCPGYGGVPLFVSEGDLRYDVDAGVPNGVFTTASPFNAIRPTVEWRLRDGRPFAVIVRYDLDAGDGGPTASELAVISVGTEGAPGCLVGWVPADAAPSQNEAARALADREAASTVCPAD